MLDRTLILALASVLSLSVLAAVEPSAPRSSISAAIKAGLPRYDPLLARGPDPAAGATEGSILLPKLIVRDTKPPPITERELHTRTGFDGLLLRRYPGLTRKGYYAASPLERINYAVQAFEDDARTTGLKDLTDLTDLLDLTGDRKGSDRLKTDIERSFMRRHDARSEELEHSVNGGRR